MSPASRFCIQVAHQHQTAYLLDLQLVLVDSLHHVALVLGLQVLNAEHEQSLLGRSLPRLEMGALTLLAVVSSCC